jgi:hypothetical protein
VAMQKCSTSAHCSKLTPPSSFSTSSPASSQ